jgi:hypothetical protein
MEVGVVDARGEIGAEEKWSDGEAGSSSSCSCGGERMPREENEEWILSCGGSRRSSYSQQGSWASASGVWLKDGRSGYTLGSWRSFCHVQSALSWPRCWM